MSERTNNSRWNIGNGNNEFFEKSSSRNGGNGQTLFAHAIAELSSDLIPHKNSPPFARESSNLHFIKNLIQGRQYMS